MDLISCCQLCCSRLAFCDSVVLDHCVVVYSIVLDYAVVVPFLLFTVRWAICCQLVILLAAVI